MLSESLSSEIEEESKRCFSKLREMYHKDDICGYALYSDIGALTICPAVNTKSNLNELVLDDPDDATYYKWSPAEWTLEYDGGGYFESISHKNRTKLSMLTSDVDITNFKLYVYEACVKALENLVLSGFFDSDMPDCIVTFTISDSELFSKEIEWNIRLNGEIKAKEFSDWICTL